MVTFTDLPAEILYMIVEKLYEPPDIDDDFKRLVQRDLTFYNLRKVNRVLRIITSTVYVKSNGRLGKAVPDKVDQCIALDEKYVFALDKHQQKVITYIKNKYSPPTDASGRCVMLFEIDIDLFYQRIVMENNYRSAIFSLTAETPAMDIDSWHLLRSVYWPDV